MLKERIIRDGSSAVEAGMLLDKYLDYGKWHRSTGKKGGYYPFGSYLMNKKWALEEEFNNHMLRFQQVTVTSLYFSKLHFDIPGWIGGH